jgi:hypothetical protein
MSIPAERTYTGVMNMEHPTDLSTIHALDNLHGRMAPEMNASTRPEMSRAATLPGGLLNQQPSGHGLQMIGVIETRHCGHPPPIEHSSLLRLGSTHTVRMWAVKTSECHLCVFTALCLILGWLYRPVDRFRAPDGRRHYPDSYDPDYYPEEEYRSYYRDPQGADARGEYAGWSRTENPWESYRAPSPDPYDPGPWSSYQRPDIRERTLSNASHRAFPSPTRSTFHRDVPDPVEGPSRTPGSAKLSFDEPRKRFKSRSSSLSSDVSKTNVIDSQGFSRAPRTPLAAQSDMFAHVRSQADSAAREQKQHGFARNLAASSPRISRQSILNSSPRFSTELSNIGYPGAASAKRSHHNQPGSWPELSSLGKPTGWGSRPPLPPRSSTCNYLLLSLYLIHF